MSSKKLSKVSDLARILMAIDNIETRCLNRKDKSVLKYPVQQLNPALIDPKNFNHFKQRSDYAKGQLTQIQQYLSDFQVIISNIYKEHDVIKSTIKQKKDNNEIILRFLLKQANMILFFNNE